jgi:predicted dehydrogenase
MSIQTTQGSANGKIAFACIGVGGKGESDTADAARLGEVVAICDIDSNTLAAAQKRYPNAKPYSDFRKLLTEMEKSIDAVTVSTPDHCHAAASVMAMQMGKHCFCQKPLTHTIYEARRMAQIAREKRVATQMGNQGTADSGLRQRAAEVRAGLLGNVQELHIWTDRPIWPQGQKRPAQKPVPKNVQWDLWLGPAPARPYGDGYHSFAWRGWWDFGTGALGDMGCHTINMPYMALDLRNPLSVEAVTAENNKDSYPAWSIVTYEFPAIPWRPGIKMVWYDGGKRPSREIVGEEPSPSGALLIGDKGRLYIEGDYGGGGDLTGGLPELVGKVPFTSSPGHFDEFVRAIKTGQPATSNFPDYAGPLTEMVLLGNLAVWSGKKIEWDAATLRAKNAPDLDKRIGVRYRSGYKI